MRPQAPVGASRAVTTASSLLLAALLTACSGDGGTDSAAPSSPSPSERAQAVPSSAAGVSDPEACLQLNGSRPLVDVPEPLRSGPTAVAVPDAPATELVVDDLAVGDGPPLSAGDCTVVNYVGVGQQGQQVFDSSFAAGKEFVVPVGAGRVIEGWDAGLPGATVGSRRRLVVPAEQAYGDAPPTTAIAPGETLVFVVDVLAVVQDDGTLVGGAPPGGPPASEPGPGEVLVELGAAQEGDAPTGADAPAESSAEPSASG